MRAIQACMRESRRRLCWGDHDARSCIWEAGGTRTQRRAQLERKGFSPLVYRGGQAWADVAHLLPRSVPCRESTNDVEVPVHVGNKYKDHQSAGGPHILPSTWPQKQGDPSIPRATLRTTRTQLTGTLASHQKRTSNILLPTHLHPTVRTILPAHFHIPRPLEIHKRPRKAPSLRRAGAAPELRGQKGGATLDVCREPGFGSACAGVDAGS